MIELMKDLPAGIIGLNATGKVTGAEYERVVIPAIDAALKDSERLRLIYHLGREFEGFEAAALWSDVRVGLAHLRAWERTAVVTDVSWLRTATKAVGCVIPGELRVYSDAQLGAAKDWMAS